MCSALAAAGIDGTPAELAIASDVPPGAGLSSSAALTVAATIALAAVRGRRLNLRTASEIAYRAEHDFVGTGCGRMDQTIVARARAGFAMHYRTASGGVRHLPFGGRVLLVHSGEERRLAEGMLRERRGECETALAILRQRWPRLTHLAKLGIRQLEAALALLPPPLTRRVHHVVTEQQRVRSAVVALGRGSGKALGPLLSESHRSLRDAYECSTSRADAIVAAAEQHGAWGARLVGAGWGGVVLVLAEPARLGALAARILADVERRVGETGEYWVTSAGRGASRAYIWQRNQAPGWRNG